MKTTLYGILLTLSLALNCLAQAPYVVQPTNDVSTADGLFLKRTGGVGGHNKWSASTGGVNYWTNDVDGSTIILRPIDQTRMIETYSISTNSRALTVINQDTNTSDKYTTGAYLENIGTNTGPGSLFQGQGNFGSISESFGNASGVGLIAGDGIGAYGLADSGFGLQFGLEGLAQAQFNLQTNVGIAASASSNGKTGTTNIGAYFEVQTGSVNPVINTSSVVVLDNRSSGVPLLVARTNGVPKMIISANGDPQIVNNAGLGKVLTSDANGIGYWQGLGVSAGTNMTAVTNNGVITVSVTDLTNTIRANAGIGPGTVNQLALFTSTTNVGDSTVRQTSTNLVEQLSKVSGSFTNLATNRIVGRLSTATDIEALEFVAGSGIGGTVSKIHTVQGSTGSSTNGTTALYVQDSWAIEPVTPILGHTAGYFYPLSDNAYALGTTSSRLLSVTTGPAGYGATVDVGSPNFTSIAGYGLAMNAARMDVHFTPGSVAFTLATNIGTAGSGRGTDYGTGSVVFGPALSQPDVFIHRTSLLKALAVGTNNNQTTKAAAVTVIASPSDDNAVDRAGGDFRLSGGPASGAGTNGNTVLGTFIKGASGFAYNGNQDRLNIRANPITLTTNSAITFLTFTLPTSLTVAGMKVSVTSEIKDATDIATVTEEFRISAVNKASTVTATNTASTLISTLATGAATISTTFTVTVSSQTVSVKCNVVTGGIQATTAQIVGARFELDSDGLSTIGWTEN